MANRMKEDEKNEKVIRGLLKLPENRRCINCNSLGPQYVCTNFWTFVCTTCSGIHREFTHRVKSVSMAKFTSQEVIALQGGGNQRAKDIYFKEWDPQRHSLPDSSNIERVRDLIKHVYVDRRYTGEKSTDKPPRVRMVDREDSYTYRSGSRSPVYEDIQERRYGESQKYGDNKRSPARFEVVDDRLRDDRFGNKRSEDNKYSDGEAKSEGWSPSYRKELNSSSPPVVRPVRDILGDTMPPLRVGEPPKAYGGRASDGSAHTRRTVSSSTLGSAERNSVELKRAYSGSLIDFSVYSKPPEVAATPLTQQTAPSTGPSIAAPMTSSTNDGNWAFFDSPAQDKVSQAASYAKTLDSVISQLLVPAAAPVGDMSTSPVGGVPAVVPVNKMLILSPGGSASAPAAATSGTATLVPISSGDSVSQTNDVGQLPSMQQPQHFLFPGVDSQSPAPQVISSVSGSLNNQLWSSSLVSNAQGSLSTVTLQSSQLVPKLAHDTGTELVSQPQPSEVKSGGRNKIPEDLFTATYSSVPMAVPGWQVVPSHGMGYGMQYPTAAHVAAFPQSTKSTNPFDLNNESTPIQVPTFPSMAPLQGALPNVSSPPGLLHTSSFGSPSPQWIPAQSLPYAAVMPSHPPSYTLGMPPSAYMGQQISSNLPSLGYQGVGGFGSDGAVFGTINTNQQPGGRFSAPATPNSFPSIGGNPFG